MDSNILARKTFAWDEQNEFAALSGDRNPMHMDALYARRTQAGRPVVHGVHLLLWALDSFLAEAGPSLVGRSDLGRIQCKFASLVAVGDTVDLRIASRSSTACRLQAKVGEATVLVLVLNFSAPAAATAAAALPDGPVNEGAPIERDFHQAAAAQGWLEISPSPAIQSCFPSLVSAVGLLRVAGLLGTTRWVGMVNPGLHSIFTGLDLRTIDDDSNTLRFRVAAAEERYRVLKQDVSGCGLAGTLSCLVRQPPVRQAAMQDVASLVAPQEFSSLLALVVGASRGLGEVTAKLIAAGGGRVIATYAVGKADAEAVAEEIRAFGGACEVLPYAVSGAMSRIPPDLPPGINCLFYFATPAVIPSAGAEFDRALFDTYLDVYASGFARVCSAVRVRSDRAVCAFYPSTVYVEPGRPEDFTEYAMAKAAGEILCSELPRKLPRFETLCRRLPRVHTDLSASAFSSDSGDPLQVMLPYVREVAAAVVSTLPADPL